MNVAKAIREYEFEKNQQVLVSIVMIAYNVENYIKQAIESVLDQEVDFRVELIIGEDCSTDNTRNIILEYASRYPDIIKPLLHPKNLGLTPNCIATHNAASGKYIALLDADDYWTYSRKLALQVEFLESNLNYTACAHQTMKVYDMMPQKNALFGSSEDADYKIIDTISHRKFHTSSLVYRAEIWRKIGGIPSEISSNERALYPAIAAFGAIRYLGKEMGVYRITGYGLSSRLDYKELETDLNMLPWLRKIAPGFPIQRFRAMLHLCIYTYPVKRIPFFPLLEHYIKFVLNSFSYFPSNFGDVKWGTIFFFRRLRNNGGRAD